MPPSFDVAVEGSNPSCGDEVRLYVTNNKRRGLEVYFDGEGCAISIAATSLLLGKVQGMTPQEANAITPENIYELLGVEVAPGREKCALLSLRTLKKALKE